jgi:hypothetical protein
VSEKHLIVFGDVFEKQIKKNLGKLKSYKEAQWLYDGILYRDEKIEDDIVRILFRDPKFAPNAIIDNGKWISPALFGNNQAIWQDAIRHCFSVTPRGQIHCFAYLD